MITRLTLAAALFVAPTLASAQVPGAPPPAPPPRAGRAAPPARRPTADEVTRIFNFIDQNKDGKLSKFEWIGAGRDIHAWDTVDTNKDGFIQPDEFQKWMETRPLPNRRAGGGGED